MKTRIASGQQSLMAGAAASLALLFSPLVLAQSASGATAPPLAAQTAPAASEKKAPKTYRSAFEGYQPYTDEKIVSWKAANDVTAQIGGWRAYAKEASETSESVPATTPAAKP